jgi:hypothetical protein
MFSDGSMLNVPWQLTPRYNDHDITLLLDESLRVLHFSLDVTKREFITGINVLLIDCWRRSGKSGILKQIPYETT